MTEITILSAEFLVFQDIHAERNDVDIILLKTDHGKLMIYPALELIYLNDYFLEMEGQCIDIPIYHRMGIDYSYDNSLYIALRDNVKSNIDAADD